MSIVTKLLVLSLLPFGFAHEKLGSLPEPDVHQADPALWIGVPFVGRSSSNPHVMNVESLIPKWHGEKQILSHTSSWSHQNFPHKKVSLQYTGILDSHREYVSADLQQEIVGLHCSGGKIHVKFNTSKEADAQETIEKMRATGTIFTASSHWGCFQDTGSSVIHEIVRVVRTSRTLEFVTVETRPIHFTKLFEHLNVSFTTSMFPKPIVMNEHSSDTLKAKFNDYVSAVEASEKDPLTGRKLHGFFSGVENTLKAAWNGVKTVANDVGTVVKTAVNVVGALTTGDASYDNSLALAEISWNYDASTGSASDKSLPVGVLTCANCFADLDVSLHFDLQIQSYTLESTQAYIDGTFHHNLDLVYTITETKQLNYDTVLGAIHLPNVDFMVGPIPFSINTTVPIHVGYDVTLTGTARFEAVSTAHANVAYGFQYTSSDGFQYIQQHDFSITGTLSGSAEVTMVDTFYLMPIVIITIDHIGGPNIGLKGFIEPKVEFDATTSECAHFDGAGISFALNWGLQLTLGASLDVEFADLVLYQKDFGPVVAWTHKWPVYSKCVDLSAAFRSLDSLETSTTSLFNGVVYTGSVQYKEDLDGCPQNVVSDVSMQFVPDADYNHIFVMAPIDHYTLTNSLGTYHVACIGQQYYILENGTLSEYPTPAGDIDVSFSSCTVDGVEGYYAPAITGSAEFSSDYGSFSIYPDPAQHPCVDSIVLYMQTQNTPIPMPM